MIWIGANAIYVAAETDELFTGSHSITLNHKLMWQSIVGAFTVVTSQTSTGSDFFFSNDDSSNDLALANQAFTHWNNIFP